MMNSKSRNRAACGVESPPVEIGLSVDDRPNKLSLLGYLLCGRSESVVASHYLRVCACNLSLFPSLFLLLFYPFPTHKHITISFPCTVSHSLFSFLCISFFFHLLSLLSAILSPGISLPSNVSLFTEFSLSFPLYLSSASIILFFPSFILFISASLCVLPSLPQQLPVFFLSDTLSLFSLKLSFPLSLSFTPLPLIFPPSFPPSHFRAHIIGINEVA